MKNVVILHGTGESDQSFWYPWLTKQLQEKGYTVSIPLLPDQDRPTVANWLPVALKENYTPETIVIGHSAGCPLMLSLFEKLGTKVKQAILVAGYVHDKTSTILQKSYDWKTISEKADDFVFINSDNDPWGCTDVEGHYMLDQIGKGKLIVMKGEGHMGSDTFKQPYKEFPFLLRIINYGK